MGKRNTKNWFRHDSWWRRLRNNRKYRYQNPEELEVVTLEDVIFMKMKNDLSFMIGNTLNLYEHQSTRNPNMPLRGMRREEAVHTAIDTCIEKGREEHLREQIRKKLDNGKNVPEIADELEEEIPVIQGLIDESAAGERDRTL